MHKEGRALYSTPPLPPTPPTHTYTPLPQLNTHMDDLELSGGMEVQLWVVGWRWVEWQCRSQTLFFPLWVISASHSCQFSFSHFCFFFSESNSEEETKTPEVKVVEISPMAKESHLYTMFYPYPLPSTLPEVCTDHSELPGGVGMQLVG